MPGEEIFETVEEHHSDLLAGVPDRRVEDVAVLLLRLDRVPTVHVPEQGSPTAELLHEGDGGAGPPLRSVPVEADRGGAGGADGDDPLGEAGAGGVGPGGADGDLG